MNRIDRLFAILLLLQHRRRLRAQDLAGALEVSKRTIYRDIVALGEGGVPIATLPGQGYELMPGYFLPPLVFTPEEAAALFLGAQLLLAQAAGSISADAERALHKIAVTLPGETRREVERLTTLIRFFKAEGRFDLRDPRLLTLQRAIEERRVVYFRYHSRVRDEVTEREVEPHYLTYSNGIWYLSGYDRMREAMRDFRLDRMDDLRALDARFELRTPEGSPASDSPTLVEVRFAISASRWVRGRQHFAFISEEPTAEGEEEGVIMHYRHTNPREMIPWLLSWGSAAEVLCPLDLRQEIRSEVQKLLAKLSDSGQTGTGS